MLAGVAGCVGIFAYVSERYPAAAHDPSHLFSVLFAVVLAGYIWLALTPPQALTASRSARRIGAGTALVVFGLGYPLVAVYSYDGQLFYLLAGLFLLIFAVHMVVPILGFQLDAALLDEGYPPGVRPDLGGWLPATLGRELGGGIFSLVLLPGWALLCGLIGGNAGAGARREFTAARYGAPGRGHVA